MKKNTMRVKQLKKEIEELDDNVEILLSYPDPDNKSVAHTDFTIDKNKYELDQYLFRTVRHPKGWRHSNEEENK
jgi:hypothetical protein